MTSEQAECLRRYIDAIVSESADSIDEYAVKSDDLWDVFMDLLAQAEVSDE